MKDSIREFLKKKGCPEHVVKGGFEGLIETWETVVTEISHGYDLTLDDYLNDMDARQLIEEAIPFASTPAHKALIKKLGRLDKIVRQIAGLMVAEVCSIYLKRQDGSLELFATEGLNPAAVHNIKTTSRTTRFLSPQSKAERVLRDAVISLAREYPFARPLVNTGRMSVAYQYDASPLTTDDGAAIQNVPLTLPTGKSGALLDLFEGENCFLALWFSERGLTASQVKTIETLRREAPNLRWAVYSAFGHSVKTLTDKDGKLKQALGITEDTVCLIRPDMHLAARLTQPSIAAIRKALQKALGQSL